MQHLGLLIVNQSLQIISIASVYQYYINIKPQKGYLPLKKCLVLSTSEENFHCPAPDSREEMWLFLHIYYPLEEICMNRYGFSIPLRNRIEILMGELLTTMLSDDESEKLDFINNRCPRHISASQIPPHQSLCKYCHDKADVLLVVSPTDRIDPETTEVLAIAQQKQIPILHYNPETFETTRKNLPTKWILYNDTLMENDLDDLFPENV